MSTSNTKIDGVKTMKTMSIMSKILQLLDNSPKPKFSGNGADRRIVDREELSALLDDLKNTIPADIKRASGILSERESTISQLPDKRQSICVGRALAILCIKDSKRCTVAELNRVKGFGRFIKEIWTTYNHKLICSQPSII